MIYKKCSLIDYSNDVCQRVDFRHELNEKLFSLSLMINIIDVYCRLNNKINFSFNSKSISIRNFLRTRFSSIDSFLFVTTFEIMIFDTIDIRKIFTFVIEIVCSRRVRFINFFNMSRNLFQIIS